MSGALTRTSLLAGVLAVVLAAAAVPARADEPANLSKERWAALSEVQFAELKAAEKLFVDKKYKAARTAYEAFMNKNTKAEVNTYCQLMMAECTRLGGKPNQAVSDFQFVIDLAPDSDDAKWARLRIAQCYRQAGDVEKAYTVFTEVWGEPSNLHPTAFWAAVEQTEILEGQQKFAERIPIWQGIVDRFSKKRVDPKRFEQVAVDLAREKIALGDADGAYELLKLVNKEADAQVRMVELARQVAARMARNKDQQPAREKLADATTTRVMAWITEKKDRPGHQELVSGVVGLLADVGKADDAAKQAAEARKIYADERWTLELSAGLFQRLGKLDEAIKQANDARKIFKDEDWTLNLYAELVWEKGDTEQALSAWDRMKDRKLAFTITSERLLKLGKLDEAIERRRKIAQLDPQASTEVFMWVGEALAKAKQWDKAIEEFRQAANEPTNLYRIAECHSAAKRYQEAINQYNEIGAAFEKETPNAVYCIALEYEKLNQPDTTIKLLRRVCRNYPKSKAASSAHVRLQSKYKIDETLGGSQGEEGEN